MVSVFRTIYNLANLTVGTGENNPRNSVSYGNGVYMSTDGGKTWVEFTYANGLPEGGRGRAGGDDGR